ncbi:hypothetical protein C1645_870833, partial [Glomus cerebriforme]
MSISYGVTDDYGPKASFQMSAIEDGNSHGYCTEASAGIKCGPYSTSAEAKLGSSLYKYSDNVGDIKFLSSKIGVKAGADPTDGLKAKFEARMDLVD